MEKNNYLLYSSNNYFIDGASIAATWIWTPAIFLAYELSINFGILGLLLFAIPNALTVVIYGLIAQKVRKRVDGFTVGDIVKERSNRVQYGMNIAVTVLLLILSSLAQLFGIVSVLSQWIEWESWKIALVVSFFCFLYTFRHGLKSSILSDCGKYIIMLACGIIIIIGIYSTGTGDFNLKSLDTINQKEMWFGWAIITILNLSMALYPDQTFWQRTFSLAPNRVAKTYVIGAGLFIIIPMLFGILGILNYSQGNMDTNISSAINIFPYNTLLTVVVLSALIATLDSNLCAISSLTWNELKLTEGKVPCVFSMFCLLALANLLFTLDFSLLLLFLIYGTIRTSVGMPIVLMIFNRFSKKRLMISTIINLIVLCPIFILLKINDSLYAWAITFIIIILPLISLRRDNDL